MSSTGRVGEEVAVEVEDLVRAEKSAFGHRLEELRHDLAEARRVVLGVLEDAAEEALGQQAHVLGEEAEDDAVEEVGDFSAGRPRPRMDCAISASCRAASVVIGLVVTPGLSFSGSKKTLRRMARFSGLARSARAISYFTVGVLVKFVRMTIRSMSQTTSSGGFSSASRYVRSCW